MSKIHLKKWRWKRSQELSGMRFVRFSFDAKCQYSEGRHWILSKVDAKRILREIRLLRHFGHENIIKILDIEPPPSLAEFDDVYIVRAFSLLSFYFVAILAVLNASNMHFKSNLNRSVIWWKQTFTEWYIAAKTWQTTTFSTSCTKCYVLWSTFIQLESYIGIWSLPTFCLMQTAI